MIICSSLQCVLQQCDYQLACSKALIRSLPQFMCDNATSACSGTKQLLTGSGTMDAPDMRIALLLVLKRLPLCPM